MSVGVCIVALENVPSRGDGRGAGGQDRGEHLCLLCLLRRAEQERCHEILASKFVWQLLEFALTENYP